MHYILNEAGEPVPEPDLMTWAKAFETMERKVKQEYVGPELWVSTVFLGLDHNYTEEGPPILWETMVFRKDYDDVEMDRCSGSREQALAMHEAMVECVRAIEALKEPASSPGQEPERQN